MCHRQVTEGPAINCSSEKLLPHRVNCALSFRRRLQWQENWAYSKCRADPREVIHSFRSPSVRALCIPYRFEPWSECIGHTEASRIADHPWLGPSHADGQLISAEFEMDNATAVRLCSLFRPGVKNERTHDGSDPRRCTKKDIGFRASWTPRLALHILERRPK